MMFLDGINLPRDFSSNFLMLLRWVHLVAGITWIGLLYFFNLVGFSVMQELDPATRGKVMPALMMRALWWFRWSAVVTVIVGIAYWGAEVSALAQAAGATSGVAMGSFFGIWTATWGILYAVTRAVSTSRVGTGALARPGRAKLDEWLLLILGLIVVAAASCLFLRLNHHGWETNAMLAIGIGGGIGWVLLLNVWGVVWRIQKRLIAWTKANAENGTPTPEKAQGMARMAFLTSRISAWLTLPLLFLMGAASHYGMFK
jgi:uncharacterized membrane protein